MARWWLVEQQQIFTTVTHSPTDLLLGTPTVSTKSQLIIALDHCQIKVGWCKFELGLNIELYIPGTTITRMSRVRRLSWRRLGQGFSWGCIKSNSELLRMRKLRTRSGRSDPIWTLPRREHSYLTKMDGIRKVDISSINSNNKFFTSPLPFVSFPTI